MNKQALLEAITKNVKQKHPWHISQERYKSFFGELPRDFLTERMAYDNLVEKSKSKSYKLLRLILSEVKVEIQLNLDELIEWELARWEDAKAHNILPGDIKKLLKEKDAQ